MTEKERDDTSRDKGENSVQSAVDRASSKTPLDDGEAIKPPKGKDHPGHKDSDETNEESGTR